jgi:multicomponent Na+:H+ antiporter subunit D
MDWGPVLPLLLIATSFVPGVVILMLREGQHRLRTALNLSGALAKPVLVVVMIAGVLRGVDYETRWALLPGIDLVLRADSLSLLFAALSATLWLLTTLYAIGYLGPSPAQNRFFGFFSLCVAVTMGIALAGNLITFFIFYELLSLVTYPMVVHRGTPGSIRAGRTYLIYTLGGGVVLFVAIVWMHVAAGPFDFTPGGALREGMLSVHVAWGLFALLMLGLGVKAALVPLHSWLPIAMVAPAPVSALLHAVAVVKAGVFGIMRVVFDVYGIELASTLGLLAPLAGVAGITIVYGSLRALAQDNLKRRLAFSTVSQLSYITLGVALFSPLATTAALVHLVHQGIMKVTLFYCAGTFALVLGVERVSGMDGMGRRMPVTMSAFTVGALGMIGLPPMAGFISKWYLGTGGLQADAGWVLWVLVASSVLNAMYFLPIVYRGWFRPSSSPGRSGPGFKEAPWTLVVPPVATAVLVVAMGLLASLPYSPLFIAELILQEVGW